jgi:ATP-dependent Clp protease ATP-binding subunit ClpC
MAFADDDGNESPGNDAPKDNAQQQIEKLAKAKARELGHAKATFNHLLYALIKKDPQEIDSLLNPKLRSSTLLNMVEKDLRQRPKSADSDAGEVDFSVEASRALKRAEVISGKNWSSDKIFAPELLHAMLETGKVEMEERSPTLDYVRMILSNHTALDAGVECRKLIDQFAAARGEKKSQQKQLTAGKSGPNNGESAMPKAAYIIPLKKDSLLAEFATNMNEKMEHANRAPVVGRENEIDEVIRILARSTKNNPALIGEAGVGKTAVIEGLVQRINAGDVPEFMKTKNILQLDLSLIVAGTKYRGQFEERLKNIMKELLELKDAIVFVDEIHTLMGAGAAEGSLDASNILKPALSRGEITVIGATTPKEFKKSIEKDKAMERRFQAVKVQEPDKKTAKLMVRAHKERLENFHGVTMPDEILDACAEMSSRYFTNDSNKQPDKGVTLADDVAVLVKLDEERSDKTVTLADVETIVAKKINRPVGTISQNNLATLKNLPGKLAEKLYNQSPAIDSVARALKRSHTGMASPRRPIGSFLFLGQTGVGKTELARLLADDMFQGEESIIRFDMSEFGEKHSVSKLIGAPPGYVGYEEGGKLTDRVKRAPYSVVLFDEIEKAHPDVADIFLQVLDNGRLTDGQGETVDFSNTIIIMTSNAITSANVMKNRGFGKSTAVESEKANKAAIIKLLQEKNFKPEFINRLSDVVTFNPLPKDVMHLVVQNEIRKIKEEYDGLKVVTIEPSPEVIPWLVEQGWEQDGKMGARPYRRLIETKLGDEFADAVADGKLRQGVPTTAKITVKPDQSGLSFEYNEAAAGDPVSASASFDAKADGLLDKPAVNDQGSAEGPAKPAVGG